MTLSPLPIWAFTLIAIWMICIPYFTKGALESIVNQAPSVPSKTAKTIALLAGLLWPIMATIGIIQIMFLPRR